MKALEDKSSDQLVVVTLPSLQGYTIEDFGYQLGRHWGIGTAKLDNGVLLIVAPNERKVRIEVGYGLEPILTDALTKIIIENAILPRFRAGDFPGGIKDGVRDIALASDRRCGRGRGARQGPPRRRRAGHRLVHRPVLDLRSSGSATASTAARSYVGRRAGGAAAVQLGRQLGRRLEQWRRRRRRLLRRRRQLRRRRLLGQLVGADPCSPSPQKNMRDRRRHHARGEDHERRDRRRGRARLVQLSLFLADVRGAARARRAAAPHPFHQMADRVCLSPAARGLRRRRAARAVGARCASPSRPPR